MRRGVWQGSDAARAKVGVPHRPHLPSMVGVPYRPLLPSLPTARANTRASSRAHFAASQERLLKSSFTETVHSRKLAPPMEVPDSEVDNFCGRVDFSQKTVGSVLLNRKKNTCCLQEKYKLLARG